VVVPGIPHHVTQRGCRRQRVFFSPDDYRLYIRLMAERCSHHAVDIWAYCLMPNHAHLIAVPVHESGLRRAIGEAHRRYALEINSRENWTGHLWQERFSSCPMDERYLVAATRYVELNPVRSGLVRSPQDWPWSSAIPHLSGKDDKLVRVRPLLDLVGDWKEFLKDDSAERDLIRKHARTGRPLGDDAFVTECEQRTGRVLRTRRRGPVRREADRQETPCWRSSTRPES
jgi:putative transposase